MKGKGKYILRDEAGDAGDGGGGPSLDGTGGTGGTGGGEHWHSGLELADEVRSSPVTANVKDAADALTQLHHLNTKFGDKRISVPQDSWTDDQWGEHHNALGRPEDSKAYKTPEIKEELKDAFNMDLFDQFKPVMHKAGLSDKAANVVMEGYIEMQSKMYAEAVTEETTRHTQEVTKLKSEWGDNFDANLQMAQAATKKIGGDSFINVLKATGMNESPEMMRVMHEVGKLLSESGAIGTGSGSMLGDQAQAKVLLDQKRGDPEWIKALYDKTHVNHENAVRENFELGNQAEKAANA